MVNRREFLASIAAAASAAAAHAGKLAEARASAGRLSPGSSHASARGPAVLAINGGKPVRDTTLFGSGCGIGTEYYDEKERARLVEVWESRDPFRWYGHGSDAPVQCAMFEKEFGERMKRCYMLGVTSGNAALMVAMAALGVRPGDEVILPAWTWYSCYNAIVLAGALPVFAEVEKSLNVYPDDI